MEDFHLGIVQEQRLANSQRCFWFRLKIQQSTKQQYSALLSLG